MDYESLEKLYASATKALNSQLEITNTLRAENRQLKVKIRKVQRGIVPMPKFEPQEISSKLDLNKPEDAYLWGWETCLLVIGEILSKP